MFANELSCKCRDDYLKAEKAKGDRTVDAQVGRLNSGVQSMQIELMEHQQHSLATMNKRIGHLESLLSNALGGNGSDASTRRTKPAEKKAVIIAEPSKTPETKPEGGILGFLSGRQSASKQPVSASLDA